MSVNSPSCSLSILVARTDIPFMMHTIPHLVKMCNFPFAQRLLAVDTAPLSGDKVNRPGVGTMEQLRDYCSQLLAAGVVDKVVDIDYSETYQRQVYRKHFGTDRIRQTHNYKGYPILGTIFSLEAVPGDYVLHFDSDMMLHQQPDYNWIEAAIALHQDHPEVVFTRPLAGPPTEDGQLLQERESYGQSDGFHHFKTFGSRAYLINRQRFDQLLPLPILWRSYKNKAFNALPTSLKTQINYATGKGKLDSWEIMVTQQLQRADWLRANLDSPKAWTLHPNERRPEFLQALPALIAKVETGWYPPEQAGHYDLKLEPWLQYL
jgi:hypothetical protein